MLTTSLAEHKRYLSKFATGYTDYELNIIGGIIIACELPGMVIAAICIGLFDFVRKVFRHISGGKMANNKSSNNVVDFPTPNEDDK